jgi:hypothetical protein
VGGQPKADEDDEVQVIDYDKEQLPDLTKVPEEIIKNEM